MTRKEGRGYRRLPRPPQGPARLRSGRESACSLCSSGHFGQDTITVHVTLLVDPRREPQLVLRQTQGEAGPRNLTITFARYAVRITHCGIGVAPSYPSAEPLMV